VVRRRRRSVVAVTGAAHGLGRLLAERLAARADLAGLIGIDVDQAPVTGVGWRSADVRDPLLRERLDGAETVVHLATTYDAHLPRDERRSLNVTGTAALLDAARSAGVGRVVLTTSVEAYGARPGLTVPVPDLGPARAPTGEGRIGSRGERERLAEHASGSGRGVTVLPPATLVGGRLGPSYDGALLRQLHAPRLLAVRGIEPLWQLCHVNDLVTALELAATGALSGAATVACEGWLPQSQVEAIVGKRRVELPATVALGTAERLHRLGVTTASPRELDHLLAPLVVTSERLRKAGWRPEWTNETALRAHVAERAAAGGVADGRSGAYTAAGATVALLGTAALVRQARRRRRGL
jgi:nucleoside-diphosphate-sugar epimerase